MCKHFTVGYLALSLLLLGASQSTADSNANTNPFGNGVYVVTDQPPDNMKTTPQAGQKLHATDGKPTPVRPSDRGVVRRSSMSDNDADGSTTVTFIGRSPKWGCAYHVDGTCKGGGGGGAGGKPKPSGWYSDFNNDNQLRIVIEVNEDGVSDDVVLIGGTGTLRVWVLGTTGTIEVSLSAVTAGKVGLPGSVSVTAGDSTPSSVTLTGQAFGAPVVSAFATVNGSYISDSRTVKVFGFSGKLSPAVSFTGRSFQKVGVGETGTLGVDPAPGTTLNDLKPLTWTKLAGSTFTITNVNTDTGTADFSAGEVYEFVTLKLTDKDNHEVIYSVTVVPPSGIRMENEVPGQIWHVVNIASVGYWGRPFVLPADVAFTNVTVSERGGAIVLHGSMDILNWRGLTHPQSPWGVPTDPNISKGSNILTWHDHIGTGQGTVKAWGAYEWPANWWYKINGHEYAIGIVDQHASFSSTGKATVFKAGWPESAEWADNSSTPPDW